MRIRIFPKIVTDSSDTSVIDKIQNDYSNYKINKKTNSAIFTKQNYRTSLLNSPTIIYPKIIEMQIIKLSNAKLNGNYTNYNGIEKHPKLKV